MTRAAADFRSVTRNELARIAKRDIKNVVDDVKYLEQMGLIERAEEDRRARPIVGYSRIDLEIAV